jgi:hypothetical protein
MQETVVPALLFAKVLLFGAHVIGRKQLAWEIPDPLADRQR